MKQEYYDFCVNDILLKPLDMNLTANHKQQIECLKCGYVFTAILKGKVNNYRKHGLQGCKKCTDKIKYIKSRENNLKFVESKFHILEKIEKDEFLSKDRKVKVKNKKCGHIFNARWDNLKNGLSNCPKCNVKEKAKRCEEFNRQRHVESLVGKTDFEKYKAMVGMATRQSYKEHKNKINPENHDRVLSGKEGYQLDHRVSIKNCFLWEVPPEICGDYRNLEMVDWRNNLFKKTRSSINVPSIIMPYVGNINKEFMDELGDFLVSSGEKFNTYPDIGNYKANFVINDTLSILLLDHKMFSQQALSSTSYLKKFKKYLIENGMKSWFIFEDEWRYKKDIILSKLNYYLHNDEVKIIYARKCIIKEIDSDTKNNFLNMYHLQGTCKSNFNLGAFYNDKLVSVMTFSQPRKQMGTKNEHEGSYELSRFCSKNNHHIPGVASKLFSFFLKEFSPSYVFSFADLRWSDGSLYEAIGFTKEHEVKPDYKYIIDGKRKHRWGFRKSLIKDRFPEVWEPSKTEYQMMLEKGFDRVWDCGYIKYFYSQ